MDIASMKSAKNCIEDLATLLLMLVEPMDVAWIGFLPQNPKDSNT
jgi:hypothetical protein